VEKWSEWKEDSYTKPREAGKKQMTEEVRKVVEVTEVSLRGVRRDERRRRLRSEQGLRSCENEE